METLTAVRALAARSLRERRCERHIRRPCPRNPGYIDVRHYALTITPDFEQRSISGETRISFSSQRDALAEVRFSANSLIVDRATVPGQPVRVARDKAEVVMVLPQPLPRGGFAKRAPTTSRPSPTSDDDSARTSQAVAHKSLPQE